MADSNGFSQHQGVIVENLPNATFRIKLEADERLVLCHLAGRMRRMRFMRFLPGDRVLIEVPDIDPSKGRVIEKLK